MLLGYHLQAFSTHEDITTKLIHRFSLVKVKNISHVLVGVVNIRCYP